MLVTGTFLKHYYEKKMIAINLHIAINALPFHTIYDKIHKNLYKLWIFYISVTEKTKFQMKSHYKC